MDHPLARTPPPAHAAWPSLPSSPPPSAAGRSCCKKAGGLQARRPFVAGSKDPSATKAAPLGRAATHSRTCRAAECHCHLRGASARGRTAETAQMTLITLDGN